MHGLFFKYEGYKFFLEGDGDYEFDDCRHLYGFLNYLYRTDEAQKWTNEMTQKNADFWFPITTATLKRGKKEETLTLDFIERFQDIEHRELLHDLALSKLKSHYGTTNLMNSKAAKYARAFVINTDTEIKAYLICMGFTCGSRGCAAIRLWTLCCPRTSSRPS